MARDMFYVARRHCSEETHGLQCFVWVGLVDLGRNVHVHRLASLASDGGLRVLQTYVSAVATHGGSGTSGSIGF